MYEQQIVEKMNCKRCHDRPIANQARKLCKRCYDYLRKHNRLGEYPKSDLFRKRLNDKYSGMITKLRLCARNPDCNLSKIGREYKISRERVSQIFYKLFNEKYSLCMNTKIPEESNMRVELPLCPNARRVEGLLNLTRQ